MSDSSRRAFLKSAALATAGPAILPAFGANDRLRVGWIGTGTRGMYVMQRMYEIVPHSVIVVAVCDTFQGALANGKDRVQTLKNAIDLWAGSLLLVLLFGWNQVAWRARGSFK